MKRLTIFLTELPQQYQNDFSPHGISPGCAVILRLISFHFEHLFRRSDMTKTMGTTTLPTMDPASMPAVTAREMMVRNLITLCPDMDALEALDVLLRNHISGAPVVDENGVFLGIFSEKSCMRFVVSMAYDGMPSTDVQSLIDVDPPTIDEETDMLTIAQKFLTESCRRLPVLDADGKLRGQISRRDVMRAVRSHLNAPRRTATASGLFFSAILSSEERRV
jgi:CBS domain-containing protein